VTAVIDREPGKNSHRRLRATVTRLSDADARRPSLLPGWSVGHVLTHLARNADSHVRLLEAAGRGEVADQYEGGTAGRAADIEDGAGRPVALLVADVVDSAARLEAAWDATPDHVWRAGRGRMVGGPVAIADLAFRRWREVEIHHVDLGLGYGIDDWPDDYVDLELARSLADLPYRLPPGLGDRDWEQVAGGRRALLAWLVGRGGGPGLPELTPWTG
jgi:maleylpyruvate isomerase